MYVVSCLISTEPVPTTTVVRRSAFAAVCSIHRLPYRVASRSRSARRSSRAARPVAYVTVTGYLLLRQASMALVPCRGQALPHQLTSPLQQPPPATSFGRELGVARCLRLGRRAEQSRRLQPCGAWAGESWSRAFAAARSRARQFLQVRRRHRECRRSRRTASRFSYTLRPYLQLRLHVHEWVNVNASVEQQFAQG